MSRVDRHGAMMALHRYPWDGAVPAFGQASPESADAESHARELPTVPGPKIAIGGTVVIASQIIACRGGTSIGGDIGAGGMIESPDICREKPASGGASDVNGGPANAGNRTSHRNAKVRAFSHAAPFIAAALLLLSSWSAEPAPLGSGFTYQGQLNEAGQPATGLYDLQLCVFAGLADPLPIACAPDFNDIPVDGGMFTIAVDAGAGPFVGEQRYLELRVRQGASSGGFTTLAPRQLLRAVPESLRTNLADAVPWSGLTGLPPGFADGIDSIGSGTVTSIAAGAGLTGGTIAASGTLAVDINAMQNRVSGNCAVGQYVRQLNADGSVVCGSDVAGGSGTVTTIATSGGLTGGPISSSGTIAVAAGGVGLAQINPGEVQARVGGVCAIGTYLLGVDADGSLRCAELQGVTKITGQDRDGAPGAFSDIAIGGDGLPIVAYSASTFGDLRVFKCTDEDCGGESIVTTIDDGAGADVGTHVSLAIPPDGLPIISYYDGFNTSLKVAKCADPACSEPGLASIRTVDNLGAVGQWNAIAIGADALPIISYYDESAGDLKLAKCADSACVDVSIAVIATAGNVGRYTSVAVALDGLPIIAYQGDASAAVTRTLTIAKCSDPACVDPVTSSTVDTGPESGYFNSLAIGGDGLPLIVHSSRADAGSLKLTRCADPACSTGASTAVLDPGPGDFAGRLKIRSDGLPAAAYASLYGLQSAVKLALCSSVDCQSTVRRTTVAQMLVGFVFLQNASVSIGLGSDGLPLLGYARTGRVPRNGIGLEFVVAKCGTMSCR